MIVYIGFITFHYFAIPAITVRIMSMKLLTCSDMCRFLVNFEIFHDLMYELDIRAVWLMIMRTTTGMIFMFIQIDNCSIKRSYYTLALNQIIDKSFIEFSGSSFKHSCFGIDCYDTFCTTFFQDFSKLTGMASVQYNHLR